MQFCKVNAICMRRSKFYAIYLLMRKRDGGKISFMRKRDGPLWINLKFFKDTEEYLDKQDAF